MVSPGDIEQGQATPSLIDISNKPSPFSLKNRVMRTLWGVTYLLLFRPSPRPLHGWRRALLKVFGAKLGRGTKVFSSAKIWAPWNLEMGDFSTIAPDVDCYSAARISIGSNSTVSQYSYLCAASHDFRVANMPLYTKPITIGSQVWVCADVFVAPGVVIHDGVVVGARSSVFRDLPPWTVCTGSPAMPRGPRKYRLKEAYRGECQARAFKGSGDEQRHTEGQLLGLRADVG